MSPPPDARLPRLLGPYSPGATGAGLLFLSGQVAKRPDTPFVEGSVADQTRQCIANLLSVLDHEGLGPRNLVKCNVYLVDMDDFNEMNRAYEATLQPFRPARTTVEVSGLPLDARVEIEAIAALPT